jgi:hypothetical protein
MAALAMGASTAPDERHGTAAPESTMHVRRADGQTVDNGPPRDLRHRRPGWSATGAPLRQCVVNWCCRASRQGMGGLPLCESAGISEAGGHRIAAAGADGPPDALNTVAGGGAAPTRRVPLPRRCCLLPNGTAGPSQPRRRVSPAGSAALPVAAAPERCRPGRGHRSGPAERPADRRRAAHRPPP